MMQRFGISFSLLIAFLLVQGHNLVPHVHEQEKTSHASSHHHDNDDEADQDPPFPADHQPEFGKILIKSNDPDDLLIKFCTIQTSPRVPEVVILFRIPPLVRPPITTSLFELHIQCSGLLRAPPAFRHFA
jgi:hypothetical protein